MFKIFKKIILSVMVVAATVFAVTAEAKFCWRDSYGRGVGTIPTDCGAGKQNDAGLCYPNCPAGYGGAGPVCWGKCPAGFSDHGAGCTKPESYGRGAGYPWKLGDKAFSLDAARSRCSKDNTQGCEKDGEIIYPKCKAGFHKVGCCICSPDCPAGFGDTGVTCTKPTQTRGAGNIPSTCTGGKQNDAGLCYNGCKTDFKGVGPVCWGKCPPSSPVDCGAGCAATNAECTQAIAEQVISVMDVAVNIATTIATAGSGTAAKAVATTAAKSAAKNVVVKGAAKAAIKAELKRLAKEAGKEIAENTLEEMAKVGAGEDFDPYALDPTGIASVVKAYNKPVCGKT